MTDDMFETSELAEEEIEEPKSSEEETEEEKEEEKEEEVAPIKPPVKRKSTRRKKKSTTTKSESSGVSEDVKPVAAEVAEPTVEALSFAVSQTRVNVRSLWPARLIVRGTPSGEEYDFPNAGALVSVNSVDVGFLMSKNKTGEQGCCGGGPRNYFELLA